MTANQSRRPLMTYCIVPPTTRTVASKAEKVPTAGGGRSICSRDGVSYHGLRHIQASSDLCESRLFGIAIRLDIYTLLLLSLANDIAAETISTYVTIVFILEVPVSSSSRSSLFLPLDANSLADARRDGRRLAATMFVLTG